MDKKKNDYSVIVFFEDSSRGKKWTYVHMLNGFSMFLNKSHPSWKYMNVYERRTRKFLKQFQRTDFIPAFINH